MDSLKDLKIRRLLTIHNMPETLSAPSMIAHHMKAQLADVDTEDITQFFAKAISFIDSAKKAKERVLVHCGAGVSRSATLCLAYLIQEHGMGASEAFAHVKERRSNVQPNPGFWRALTEFAKSLGAAFERPPPPAAAASGRRRLQWRLM